MNISKLRILNPRNSLFGKIFIWFWLTVIAIILITVAVSNIGIIRNSVLVPEPGELSAAHSLMEEFEAYLDQGDSVALAIEQLKERDSIAIVAMVHASGFVQYNAMSAEPKIRFEANPDILLELVTSPTVVTVQNGAVKFTGPYKITGEDGERFVFFGRLVSLSNAFVYLSLGLMISIGTGLCVFLAWYLSKPIKDISIATRKMSQGDLCSIIPRHALPNDEVGMLGLDFNTMTDNLRASIRGQQQLMANISHELRTPITRLQLSLALLDDTVMDAKGRTYLNKAEGEIEKWTISSARS